MDYRKLFAALFVGLAIWFVPAFFRSAADVTNEVASVTADVAGEAYNGVTDAPEPYAGPTHVVVVRVLFEINRAYHEWGQLLASYHQLPEISGRVYAALMLPGQERITLPNAGLVAQVRRNWHADPRCAADRSRSCRNSSECRAVPGDRCIDASVLMEWTDIRVRVPEYHLPIGGRSGWWLCVYLHEGNEGHNILGTVQDGLHQVHLSDGDQSVADECVALDNNSFPYDYPRRAKYRPGETVPTGWLTVRFEGTAG